MIELMTRVNLLKLKRRRPDTPKRTRLGRVNNILLILIVVIDLYVIMAPLAPGVVFWWQSHHGHEKQTLTAQIHTKASPSGSAPAASQPNSVIIPSMLLNQPILEGPISQQYSILDKGIWRWPDGSSPDKGGNTVLVGHRFTYTNPRGVFYFLNKVSIGDEIGLIWNNTHYIYKVASITEVPPTDTDIENNTDDARLTIFTCTPLWLPKDRLVVVAELESKV